MSDHTDNLLKFQPGDAALFTGIEQEGWRKGKQTLFVVGDVEANRILAMIYDLKIKNIYFGAAGHFDFNKLLVETIAEASKIATYQIEYITIESPNFDKEFWAKIRHKFGYTLQWTIPFIWEGKLLPDALKIIDELVNEENLSLASYSNVFAKAYIENTVTLFALDYVYINYVDKSYADDRLRWLQRKG